jgi:hypothetical protein
MIDKLIAIAKKNWIFVAVTVAVVIVMILFSKMEKYYDYEYMGCSTCSSGEAGVFPGTVAAMVPDKEYEGCQTCDAGDAGVLEDTEQEMYRMPDFYYDDTINVADTLAEVGRNPDGLSANINLIDREEDNEMAAPINYQAESDKQLVDSYYGTYSSNDGQYSNEPPIYYPYAPGNPLMVDGDYETAENENDIDMLDIDESGEEGMYTLL